jgi:hypothetical protein
MKRTLNIPNCKKCGNVNKTLDGLLIPGHLTILTKKKKQTNTMV